MNNVTLIGRLTRDIELKYTSSGMAVARFTVAIDRPPKKDGTKEADFPTVITFGKTAENCDKFIGKGSMIGVSGRLQTGSYEKNGAKVYTTDIVADRVEFLNRISNGQNVDEIATVPKAEKNGSTGLFEALNDEDIPF